jgi:aryl-phospho-beta-D-glucosidase BglC (GH1 family)
MQKFSRFFMMYKVFFILSFIFIFIYVFSPLYAESPDIKRLTGVNWFGFETGAAVPHGLWARDYKSMLKQIKDLGFNCIRIPWADEMLNKHPNNITINEWVNDPYTGHQGLNLDLAGRSSLEVLDKIIEEAGRLDLRIILDCHSRALDGYMSETLWYTDEWPESRWILDWVSITQRYLHNPAVVAFDINNEPHGGLHGTAMKPPASWGYNVEGYGDTDWKAAAERCTAAIRQVNPDIIIIIQGVQESSDGSNYWWGSNHKDLKEYPVTSIPGSKLMFSVHEYGPSVTPQPWFDDPAFPNNLEALWRDRFWFIYEENIAGLYIGEMGLKEEEAQDQSSIAYQWFTKWLEFAGNKVHWTYWCWNPNSGDTGGILKDDWVSVNQIKYNLIKPYLEPWTNGTATPAPWPTPPLMTPSPTPWPTPPLITPSPTPWPTPTPDNGIIIQASFTASSDGFVYYDDTFRETNIPTYASGAFDINGGMSGGGLRVYLGGVETGGPVSGGWSYDFEASGEIVITLDYRMTLGKGYEPDEYGETIAAIDDNIHVLDTMYGDGDLGRNMDTGWRSAYFTTIIGPGRHTVTIGAYNNHSSQTDEWVDLFIDNVRVEQEPAFTPAPTSTPTPTFPFLGDVDLNGTINIIDALLIAQYFVGLNPDTFYPGVADVNCDGSIDMIDALFIARYYIGHPVEFC